MEQTPSKHPGPFSLLNRLWKKTSWPTILLLFFIFVTGSGCFRHFYSTNTTHRTDSATLVKLIDANKYFILHDSANRRILALTNLKISNENLVAETTPLLSEHEFYEYPRRSQANAFPVKYKDVVLYEVHLYTLTPGIDSIHVNIPLKDFTRMDVYTLDKRATDKARVTSIIGITLTTAGTIAIIAAIIESNKTPASTGSEYSNVTCSPEVYLEDHQQKELQGTLYSGAIAASLERTDYMPLSVKPGAGDKVRLSIKGKDEEDIMLHRVHLLQVRHKKGVHVLVDRKGNILTYNNPVNPHQALIDGQLDIRPELMERDGKYYSFTSQAAGDVSSEVIFEFRKPQHAAAGKLIISAKNSNWSYYLFNQFKSLYGDYYPDLIQKKDRADSAQVMRCELDQYLPLLVSLKTKEGWKLVDYFPTAGVSTCRDLIMNIDLKEFTDNSSIQVKLQTTYMFWNLDYAAMDFSSDKDVQTSLISPSLVSLVNRDQEPVTGASYPYENIFVKGPLRLDLEFDTPVSPAADTDNSYFLTGKGYYHDNSRYEGKARVEELVRFSGKGAFDKYSREKFAFILKSIQENNRPDLITAK